MSASAIFAPPTFISPRRRQLDRCVVVGRKLARQAAHLGSVVARADELLREPIALGAGGRLVAHGRFVPVDGAPVQTWATTARVHVAGLHLAKFVRVELEISEHSAGSCALDVRPISPNVRRWGKWRSERYFNLAHQAADTLTLRLLP